IGDRAVVRIEPERMDHAGGGVDEIHRAAVRTPAEPVGDRQPTHDQLSLSGVIESIERSATSTLIMGQSAGPEAALRIASGIVHSSVFWCDLRHRAHRAVRAKVAEAACGGKQPTVIT